MNLPAITMNEKCERIISLWRNGERVHHVFPDHWLEFREVAENGRGPLYYIIAHNYGTGEKTLVFLKDQQEYDILERELSYAGEAPAVEDGARNIGKDFVEAVKAAHARRLEAEAEAEALRCIKFCEEEERKAEIAYEARRATWPVEVGFFGVEPRISDDDLKELCCKPFEATTDALRLKELEGRFPGATMVLSTTKKQIVVKYVYEEIYVDSSANHMIACDVSDTLPFHEFASIGASPRPDGKPQLMAEWRGMYVDLSHLF
jgi:hypothetical protein